MAKILQIIPSLDQINGGVERGTLDIAKELIKVDFNRLCSPLEERWPKSINIEE